MFLLDLAANQEGRFLGIDCDGLALGQRRTEAGTGQVRFCRRRRGLEDLEEFGLVLDEHFDAYMLGAAASVATRRRCSRR